MIDQRASERTARRDRTGNPPPTSPLSNSRGFTLIEVSVVIVVIGILALVGIPSYVSMVDKARVVQAIGDLKALSLSIDNHWLMTQGYPINLAALDMSDYDDPWERSYVYIPIDDPGGGPRQDDGGVSINTDYELYSVGRDGASSAPLNAADSADDVVRGNNGGFLGLANQF